MTHLEAGDLSVDGEDVFFQDIPVQGVVKLSRLALLFDAAVYQPKRAVALCNTCSQT
jgi:hypothetical protein